MIARRSSRSLTTPPGEQADDRRHRHRDPDHRERGRRVPDCVRLPGHRDEEDTVAEQRHRHARHSSRKSRCRSGASRFTPGEPAGAVEPRRNYAASALELGAAPRRTSSAQIARSGRRAASAVAKRKPWPSSQPRLAQRLDACSAARFPRRRPRARAVSPIAMIAGGRGRCRRCRRQERAVHLEDVDRQPAQVAERGVAGAEVVHRDPDAELLERAAAAATARSVSAIITVSVISRTRRRRRQPGRRRASRTSSTIVSDWSCLTDRLTLIGAARSRRTARSAARLAAGLAQHPAGRSG